MAASWFTTNLTTVILYIVIFQRSNKLAPTDSKLR